VGMEGIKLFIAMFVVFPFPIFTVPYMAMSLYLLFNKKPRGIDTPAIILCGILLVSLLVPGIATMMIFFLPYIIVGTPFGLILIPVLIVILVITLRRRKKRHSP